MEPRRKNSLTRKLFSRFKTAVRFWINGESSANIACENDEPIEILDKILSFLLIFKQQTKSYSEKSYECYAPYTKVIIFLSVL